MMKLYFLHDWVRHVTKWVNKGPIYLHLPEMLPSPMHILHLSFHQNMGKGKGKGKENHK